METNKSNNARQYVQETYGLSLHEVSANLTGSDYHRSYSVLTGFETFEQAQDVANKFGLAIRELRRRDGRHTWTDKNEASEALHPMEICGDDCLFERYKKGSDTVADIIKELHGAIEGMDDEEAVEFVKKYNDIIEDFADLEDGAWVAVNENGVIMTFEDETMECSDGDVTRYIIGVTDYGKEDKEE